MQKWGQQRERIEHDKENAPLKWKCFKKKVFILLHFQEYGNENSKKFLKKNMIA